MYQDKEEYLVVCSTSEVFKKFVHHLLNQEWLESAIEKETSDEIHAVVHRGKFEKNFRFIPKKKCGRPNNLDSLRGMRYKTIYFDLQWAATIAQAIIDTYSIPVFPNGLLCYVDFKRFE